MSEKWKRFEGRTVDGKVPLQNYLGGSDHSAVFLTTMPAETGNAEHAAVKLIAVSPADAERQFADWTSARDLNRPNVIRIFESGRCEVDGTKLLYVVEEYAEENLAQILPDRALTSEETRGMLPPVLGALQAVHAKSLVHGSIRPSNIFAIGDQIKLASDTFRKAGEKDRPGAVASAYTPPEAGPEGSSAAGDVWQLGMTLIEVLTQRLPVWDRSSSAAPEVSASIPEPFRGIAQNCLQIDPAKRPSVAQIGEWLEAGRAPKPPVASAMRAPESKSVASPANVPSRIASSTATFGDPKKASSKLPYLLGLAAAGVIAIYLVARPKPATSPAETQPTQVSESTARPEATQISSSTAGTRADPVPPSAIEDKKTRTASSASDSNAQGDVVKRAVPEVSPSARRTIHGKIQVKIKVSVDAAGNVTKAKLESGRGSKYFNRIALDAARDWKFSPAPAGETGDRDRLLQFGFSRSGTDASVVRGKLVRGKG